MELGEGPAQCLCGESTVGASLSYCSRCDAVRRNLTHFVNQIWKPSEADGGQGLSCSADVRG
jgi:hypothetical protein